MQRLSCSSFELMVCLYIQVIIKKITLFHYGCELFHGVGSNASDKLESSCWHAEIKFFNQAYWLFWLLQIWSPKIHIAAKATNYQSTNTIISDWFLSTSLFCYLERYFDVRLSHTALKNVPQQPAFSISNAELGLSLCNGDVEACTFGLFSININKSGAITELDKPNKNKLQRAG